MKILLIIPPFASHNRYIDRKPPLSVMYLAASLIERGYRVQIYDASMGQAKKRHGVFYYGVSRDALIEKITIEKPHIVGVTCFLSSRWAFTSMVCDMVKTINLNIITVVGGIHPSTRPVECLQSNSNIDYVIIGEGEDSFSKLVFQIDKEKKKAIEPKGIDGIAYHLDGQIVHIPKETYIGNLDELSFPARHLIDWGQYFKGFSYRFDMRGKFFSLLSSRSCPFKCSFCNIYITQGKKWRARTPINVVDEMEHCISRYGVRKFCFEDDNLTLDKKRVQNICREILNRELKVSFNTPNGINLNTLDEGTLEWLKRAGCKSVLLAIESGNNYIRNDVYHKNLEYSQIEKVVKYCHMIKLDAYGLLMVGAPQETDDTIRETISMIKRLPLKGINISIFTPYLGTELHDEAVAKGYLSQKNKAYLESGILDITDTPLLETSTFSFNDVKRWQRNVYLEFIKRNLFAIIKGQFQNGFFAVPHLLRMIYQFLLNPVRNLKGMENITAEKLSG